MDRWNGKIALVTGVSSGIGLGVCKILAENGMHVVGCARRAELLENLRKEISSTGGVFTSLVCDLSKEDDVRSMFEQIKATYGGVDVCINNAAFAYASSLMDGTVSEWKNVLDVNVIATCLCTQLAIKSMRERNFDNGHIININSMSGHRVAQSPGCHFYSSTKYAVTSITEGFRQELRAMKSHIRITSISPGLVDTEFLVVQYNKEKAKEILAEMESLQVVDIAKIVKDVLSSHPRAEINEVYVRPTEQLV